MSFEKPPIINAEQENQEEVKEKPEVGDLVQWSSQGGTQWEQPRQIKGFSDDGKYAFVEDSQTGIPVSQLSIESRLARVQKSKIDLDALGPIENPNDPNFGKTRGDLRREYEELMKGPTREVVLFGGKRFRIPVNEEWEKLTGIEKDIHQARYTLHRKGFEIDKAGLDMLEGGKSVMGGYFTVDEKTEKALAEIGVSVERDEHGRSSLIFTPESQNQESVSKKMVEIADVFPYPGEETEDNAEQLTNQKGEMENENDTVEKSGDVTETIPNNTQGTNHPENASSGNIDKQKEVSKTKEKANDFFSKLASDPEKIFKNFHDVVRTENTDGSRYTLMQGARIVLETMASIYPDVESRAERLRQMFAQFEEFKKVGQKERPGKEDHAYKAFASKKIFAKMPENERELFELKVGGIVKKSKLKEGEFGVSNTIDPTFVMGDFFNVLDQLNS